jgi:hypothetical protein
MISNTHKRRIRKSGPVVFSRMFITLLLDSDCIRGGDNINNIPRLGVQGVAYGVGVGVNYRATNLACHLALAVGILGVFKDTVNPYNIKAIPGVPTLVC